MNFVTRGGDFDFVRAVWNPFLEFVSGPYAILGFVAFIAFSIYRASLRIAENDMKLETEKQQYLAKALEPTNRMVVALCDYFVAGERLEQASIHTKTVDSLDSKLDRLAKHFSDPAVALDPLRNQETLKQTRENIEQNIKQIYSSTTFSPTPNEMLSGRARGSFPGLTRPQPTPDGHTVMESLWRLREEVGICRIVVERYEKEQSRILFESRKDALEISKSVRRF